MRNSIKYKVALEANAKKPSLKVKYKHSILSQDFQTYERVMTEQY